MFFFKNHAENAPGRLVLGVFLFLKKALYDVKENAQFMFLCNPPKQSVNVCLMEI